MNKTVEELERAGAAGITVVETHPVCYGYATNYLGFPVEAFNRHAHPRTVRLEAVHADQDWEHPAKVVQDICTTGVKGDGGIFVTEVVAAVRTRESRLPRGTGASKLETRRTGCLRGGER